MASRFTTEEARYFLSLIYPGKLGKSLRFQKEGPRVVDKVLAELMTAALLTSEEVSSINKEYSVT